MSMESNWVGLTAQRCQSPRSWLFLGLPRGSEKALLEGGHVPRATSLEGPGGGERVCVPFGMRRQPAPALSTQTTPHGPRLTAQGDL